MKLNRGVHSSTLYFTVSFSLSSFVSDGYGNFKMQLVIPERFFEITDTSISNAKIAIYISSLHLFVLLGRGDL